MSASRNPCVMSPSPAEPRLRTHERRLDNGLTVLVREDHASPVAAIVTHVKAGYFDEPDALVGISHVLEHMFFKGTRRRGVGDIARETKIAGGYLNAGTIYDYTSYYTVLPASSLERGLDIQSDALRNSQIDEEELRRELLVIIQEAKRKLDNPSAVASETLYELMFDVHPMRRWRIGTEEGLRRLTRGDVWSYYRALYRPSNIILVVAGDVEAERTFAQVERFYGDMPAGEVLKQAPPREPERSGLRFREIEGDIGQAYIEWGWRTPGTAHPDTAAVGTLGVILGQGRASRLYRGVRERGYASAVSAYNYTPTDVGVFGVSAELPPADSRGCLAAVGAEIEAVLRSGVTPAELQRAKNILEARHLRRHETAEGQAMLLASWQALGDWRLADRHMERVLGLTPDDVHAAAARYLARERASVVVYRPRAAPLDLDAETLDRLLEAGDVAPAPPHAPALPGAPPAAPARRRATGHAVPLAGGTVHTYTLANGARVVVRPRRTTPLVAIGLCYRGGALHESEPQAGVTSLLAQASLKGTATRSADDIAEATEALGGSIAPGVSADLLTWSLSLPSRHFARGFELLADVALHPAFPARELERERDVALSEIERLRDDMYHYPYKLFLEGAFAGHPYGVPVATTERALRGLGRDEVAAWHRREVLHGAPWLIVVGDVDPDDVAARAEVELAAIAAAEAGSEPARPLWPGEPVRRIERREREQTALVLGFPGAARGDAAIYPLQVLANALSGLGGRFFDELRERRSLAYSVSVYPVTRWLGGAFVAYVATSPEKEEDVRRALLEGFERLAEEGLDADELERSKRYTIGAWQIRNQTNAAHLGALSDALLLGAGLDDLAHLEERIEAVTRDEVRDALRACFDPDRLVEGIVRGGA